MVFVTTLLLILLIVVMNATAIYIRNRLRRRFAGSQF
jgi:phosphate transport system permease protein